MMCVGDWWCGHQGQATDRVPAGVQLGRCLFGVCRVSHVPLPYQSFTSPLHTLLVPWLQAIRSKQHPQVVWVFDVSCSKMHSAVGACRAPRCTARPMPSPPTHPISPRCNRVLPPALACGFVLVGHCPSVFLTPVVHMGWDPRQTRLAISSGTSKVGVGLARRVGELFGTGNRVQPPSLDFFGPALWPMPTFLLPSTTPSGPYVEPQWRVLHTH